MSFCLLERRMPSFENLCEADVYKMFPTINIGEHYVARSVIGLLPLSSERYGIEATANLHQLS
jgi:hypothetical protein